MTQTTTGAERQPLGFASPRVAPLSQVTPIARADAAGPAPDAYAAPEVPGVPLADVAPAEMEPRDPTTPFLEAEPEAEPPSWQPTQPLGLSASASSLTPEPQVDPSTLPPPTGMPVGVPASPYPQNPYATGPYSGRPPVPSAGGYQQREPVTWQRALQAADSYVLGLLLVGVLWPQVAAYALGAAAILGFVRRSQGRVLLAVAAGFIVAVTAIWWFGYFATSQWQASAQLMCVVCLLGVPLISYQSLRR